MGESERPRQRATPCSDCPWRRDAEPGQFPTERYEALIVSARQELGAMFACHKTSEGRESPCAGYLAVAGATSITVRLAALAGSVDLAAIDAAVTAGEFPPMYGSFGEMAAANGVDPSMLDDPDLWVGRGPLGNPQ